jgi:hypothetical protein
MIQIHLAKIGDESFDSINTFVFLLESLSYFLWFFYRSDDLKCGFI